MLNPGIYPDITEAEYQSDITDKPSLSASICKILIAETPLHAWTAHPKLNPDFVREEKEAFDLGTVAHALMLQGLEVAAVVDFDDWRKDKAKAEREALRREKRIPILKKHWARVQLMVNAGKVQLAAHKEAAELFGPSGDPECTIVWEDDHGIMCRGRLDWLRRDHKRIADYKGTGSSINPEFISRYALSQGWDIQSSFYRRGIKKLTGIDAEFDFVAQEDQAPFALAVFGMGPDFLWAGDDKVQRAIDKWAECLNSGKWPGYPNVVQFPALPLWE